MAIPKHELEKMNQLLDKGAMITEIAQEFPDHDYWDIYWSVKDYGILGKKRMISYRIKWARTAKTDEERNKYLDEIAGYVSEIYDQYKVNGRMLREIAKILER